MNLRGVAWFSLYLVVLFLPAVLAAIVDPVTNDRSTIVEVSVALGLLAYPLIVMQFALVSHLQASSRPFGTDALVQFHQYMGFAGLAFVLVHPLLLNLHGLSLRAWIPFAMGGMLGAGALATLAIVALVVTTVFRRPLRLSYEWWQALHLVFALTAAAGIVVHILSADGYARATPVRYVVLLYGGVFLSTAVHYRVLRPLGMRARPWEVTSNRPETGDTRTLRLRAGGHGGFTFEAGQFAWLVTGASPWSPQRHPLSIASSAAGGPAREIEFAVRAMGDWSSTVVPGLGPGTRVWVDGPFGAFTLDRKPAAGFVFVAGGIGIAPVLSMLRTLRDGDDRRPLVVFYSGPDEMRLAFRDELERLRTNLDLKTVLVVTRGKPTSGSFETGRISEHMLKRHLPPGHDRYRFFLCGPPSMMDAVAAALGRLGVARDAIETERFNVV
jgi:predicted ferric reductase